MDVDPAYGHWLAGFIDGEGCFTMSDKTRFIKGKPYRYCTPIFTLCCRLDEAGTIREIHERLGVGNVYTVAKRYKPEPGKEALSRPTIRLHVQGKPGCRRLVEVFSTYPLRAKKARDFEIWRQAVREQEGRKDLAALLAYKDALVDIKRYRSEVEPIAIAPSPQLRLVENE